MTSATRPPYTQPSQECGMPVQLGEYHPFAACLMFKGSGDAEVVRVNLQMITRQWFAMGRAEGQHDHG